MLSSTEPTKASLRGVDFDIPRLKEARISMLGLLRDFVLTTLPLLPIYMMYKNADIKFVRFANKNLSKEYLKSTFCDVCSNTGNEVDWRNTGGNTLQTLFTDHLLLNRKYDYIALSMMLMTLMLISSMEMDKTHKNNLRCEDHEAIPVM